jgi:hypothetical protein
VRSSLAGALESARKEEVMKVPAKRKSSGVRIGKNLTFSFAELEAIAAQHDEDHRQGIERPLIGKLDDLIGRYPSSAAVPTHIAVPVSKRDETRLRRLAKTSGVNVESLLAGWVREKLDRLDSH